MRVEYQKIVASGILYHAASGKVLLHLRSADAPTHPSMWAFFGGRCEPGDGGDAVVAWRREMDEELGVGLDAAYIKVIREEIRNDGAKRHSFYYEWPALDESFVLTEGERYAWFTLDEALGLPNLIDYAREHLLLFGARLERYPSS
jgi:8-oxo-dGTP pyrophosphatase MutT (NUDIX family)